MELNSFSEYLLLEKLKKNSKVNDIYITYKFAKLIRTDFNKWDAYYLKLIDNQGNKLKEPETAKEKKALGLFEELVRKIKRSLVKYAGKNNILLNLISLYLLQKESLSYTEHKIKREISDELTNEEIEMVENILMILKDKVGEF